MVKGILIGIAVGILLVFVGVYFYFAGGYAPVATKGPEMPFEHRLAHIGQHAYLDKLPHPQSPVPADETNLLTGAKVYKEHCAVCHGLPGEPKTAIAEGMAPAPPQLFRGTGVTDDEVWETYWKAYNGIRMTGMPAFGDRLGETKIWQVSQLLKHADNVSAAVKNELTSATEATPPPSAPAAATPTTPPTAPANHSPPNH